MIKRIICKDCFAAFAPLCKKDFTCPECLTVTKPPKEKLSKDKKPIDAFCEMFPPHEEGITWDFVHSPYKAYKEGV